MARKLRDISGGFGGLLGGAAKKLRGRRAQLDAAIDGATKPKKKKRRAK